jgi:putative hydrolase of the HAD superfamily
MNGLLLDIGGVVLRGGSGIAAMLAEEVPPVRDEAARLGVATAADALWRRMLSGQVSERQYWATRAADLGRAVGEVWDTRAFINRLYDRPSWQLLNQEVVALMVQARQSGIPVVALTNDLVNFHGQPWVDRQRWLRHFNTIVDGSLTGILKPDPRAFAAGIAAVGLPAAQIVYLDDMPWNVAGGIAAGLRTVEVDGADPGPAAALARSLLGLGGGPNPEHALPTAEHTASPSRVE